jgi:hypothetical protein
MAVHEFDRRFAEADRPEVQERVTEILRRDLDAIDVTRSTPSEDKQGVDFWAHRAHNRRLGVDLKFRRRDWGDIHIELVSRVAERTPGWTIDQKKITDYVLYLLPKTHLLLPFAQLQAAVRRNEAYYRESYGITPAKSKSQDAAWATEGAAIPVGVLFRDIFGIGAPVGTPLTRPRLCLSCNQEHPAGTTCADGWAPAYGVKLPEPVRK